MNENQMMYRDILCDMGACQEAIDFVFNKLADHTPEQVYNMIDRISWLSFIYGRIIDLSGYETSSLPDMDAFVCAYDDLTNHTVHEEGTELAAIEQRYSDVHDEIDKAFDDATWFYRKKYYELLPWIAGDDFSLRREIDRIYDNLCRDYRADRAIAKDKALIVFIDKVDEYLLASGFMDDYPKADWSFVEEKLKVYVKQEHLCQGRFYD